MESDVGQSAVQCTRAGALAGGEEGVPWRGMRRGPGTASQTRPLARTCSRRRRKCARTRTSRHASRLRFYNERYIPQRCTLFSALFHVLCFSLVSD